MKLTRPERYALWKAVTLSSPWLAPNSARLLEKYITLVLARFYITETLHVRRESHLFSVQLKKPRNASPRLLRGFLFPRLDMNSPESPDSSVIPVMPSAIEKQSSFGICITKNLSELTG